MDGDAAADATVDAEAEAEAETEAEAEGDELADADADAEVEGDGDRDGDGDGDGLADACVVGDWDADALVVGDADAGSAPDALGDDDAIADGDTETDADALAAVGRAEADAVGEEVRAACRDWMGTLADCPLAEARTKPAAAATASSPPIAHASTSGRLLRRCGRRPPSGPGGPSTRPEASGFIPDVTVSGLAAEGAELRSSPPGTCAAEPASMAFGADPAVPRRNPGHGGRGTCRGIAANARMIDPGSQSEAGAMALTSVSSAAGGRPLARVLGQAPLDQRPYLGRHLIKAGELWTTRYSNAAVVPVPNGPWPVAAKAMTAPRLKMSLGARLHSLRPAPGT